MHIRRMPSPTVKQRDNGAALAITTTFVPPPQCTQGQLTMLARQQFFVWLNEPVPVTGTTVSFCYPQQFMTSYLDSLAGTTLPAFSPLVCPQSYQTMINQNLGGDAPYIVCCPNNYGFHPPDAPDPNRPGAGGTCFSNIISTTVTKYNEDAFSGLIFFSTSGQAYAHPLDGFAFQGQHVATTSQAVVAPVTSSSPVILQSSLPSPSSSPSASAAAITTSASSPTTSESAPTILTRSASSQSTSTQTFSAITTSTIPSSLIPLSTQGTMVIFSTVQPLVVTILAPESSSALTTTSQPSGEPSSIAAQSSALGNGQKAGIAIGVILGALLLGAIAFFLLRRRHAQSTPAEISHSPPYTFDKPSLADHPSTRGYPNEKQLYKSTPVTQYHELSSPQMETHELGAGIDGNLAQIPAKELEAIPTRRAKEEFGNFTQVSTFSPTKT